MFMLASSRRLHLAARASAVEADIFGVLVDGAVRGVESFVHLGVVQAGGAVSARAVVAPEALPNAPDDRNHDAQDYSATSQIVVEVRGHRALLPEATRSH